MPRCARVFSDSRIYHVMVRGNEKRDIFLDKRDKEKFINILGTKKKKFNFEVYAYCLMNNHVHLLINENNSSISNIMQSINVTYAGFFNKKYHRVGHLFQDRFKSEVIDTDAYLLGAVRYIHNNPVKAMLVQLPKQYEWSSYLRYIDKKTNADELIDTHMILSLLTVNSSKSVGSYAKFHGEHDEYSFIDLEDKAELAKNKINTVEEAYDYLIKRNIYLDNLSGMEFKKQIGKELKDNSTLSIREISSIVGVSKSVIGRL